jgi:hypothetical protein
MSTHTQAGDAKNPETKGTQMAERTRKQANGLSDDARHAALGKALEVIYKGGRGKICADRR